METSTGLTKEQKEFRIGKFCCSSIYKLMGQKGLGKTGETYIYEVAAEFMTGQQIKPDFYAQSTQWGIDHEEEAGLYFEAATHLKIEKCNTISNDLICGTPDGKIISDNSGFEIKCPFNSSHHLRNLLLTNREELLDLRPEYFWQIYGYFWLLKCDKYRFCSYDPRFSGEKRMLILNITQDDAAMTALVKRVTEAKLIFDNIIQKLKS